MDKSKVSLTDTIKSFGWEKSVKALGEGQVIVRKAIQGMAKSGAKRSDYHPSEEELISISENYAMIDVKAEDYYYIPCLLSSTETDRDFEHNMLPFLRKGMVHLLAKSQLTDHEWEIKREIGIIGKTWVVLANESASGESELWGKILIPNLPKNEEFLTELFLGIHRGSSIGFSSPVHAMTCDSCNRDVMKMVNNMTEFMPAGMVSIWDRVNCPHQPGAYDEYGEITKVANWDMADGYENSFVTTPSVRSAGPRAKAITNEEINKMTVKVEETETAIIEEAKDATEALTSRELENTVGLGSLKKTEDGQYIPSLVTLPEEGNSEEILEPETVVETEVKNTEPVNPDTASTEISNIINDSTIRNEITEEPNSTMTIENTPAEPTNETVAAPAQEVNAEVGKEATEWSVALKSQLDNISEGLKSHKEDLANLNAVLVEIKETFSRFTTPMDGYGPEFEARAAKQQEQADLLDQVAEKLLSALEVMYTNQKSPEVVEPEKSTSWAGTLQKKLFTGGNQ